MFISVVVIFVSTLLSLPLGKYLAWVFEPSAQGPTRHRLEQLRLRAVGRISAEEQSWQQYSISLLVFSSCIFALSFVALLTQHLLPLNPDGKGPVEPTLAFHTAASFATNTNLQHYSGEVSMSYFSQLFALMWLQFVSAGTGLAALAALTRALAGRRTMGNFFSDLWRATALVLIPLSLIWAGLLVVLGVPMTFQGSATATTLEGAIQVISRGPVAAFVAVKQLGTNGGGFFGPNSTHPFENPNYWSNVASNVAILLLPMSCIWMFGHMTGRMRHAAVIFTVMFALYLGLTLAAAEFESAPAQALAGLPVTREPNLEGKELRFGAHTAALWATSTTVTSNGSVNAMHDSLNPLTGLVPLTGMWLNAAFGGVGVGFINMFVFIIVAVFIAGMMVGRTPEYLMRRVETHEMKLALFALLLHPLLILGGTALFAGTPLGHETVQEQGSHGFSEIVYEISSAAANNGSGFEGLQDNTPAWNVGTGAIMLLARFLPIILPLAIAGSLSSKRTSPETSGTLRVDTILFGLVLLGTLLIIGALLFLPLAVLGPIAEYLAVSGVTGR